MTTSVSTSERYVHAIIILTVSSIYFEGGVLNNTPPQIILDHQVPLQLYQDTIHTINRQTQKTFKKKYLGVFEVCAVSATCCIIVGFLFMFCVVGLFCLVIGFIEVSKSGHAMHDAVGDAQDRIQDFLQDMNRNEFYEYSLRMDMGVEHADYSGQSVRYYVDIMSIKST
jgi:hypothetical protein